MWSTITSPTNSTKKLIVVQKRNPRISEPQLIQVDSNDHHCGSHNATTSTTTKLYAAVRHHSIGNNNSDDLLFRQNSSDSGGLASKFRSNKTPPTMPDLIVGNRTKDVAIMENNRGSYHVTTTLSKGTGATPAKVALTLQKSVDNKTPVTFA